MWFNISRSCSYAQFIAIRMYIHFMCAYVYLHLHYFVCNSTYSLKCSFQIYQKRIVVFIRSSKVWFKTTWCAKCYFKRKYLNLIDSNCDVDESSRSRVAICCVGLAARNFGNGRVVLCTWEKQLGNLSEHAPDKPAWTRGNCVIYAWYLKII